MDDVEGSLPHARRGQVWSLQSLGMHCGIGDDVEWVPLFYRIHMICGRYGMHLLVAVTHLNGHAHSKAVRSFCLFVAVVANGCVTGMSVS
jgi:hypothetical protein